ncbi:hypothetical protein B0H13DRAFT_1932967 [Mycena leptocephala]|nr:hypothetical protein B0H13DRAFT_1932967 [Mycena leptocephala]
MWGQLQIDHESHPEARWERLATDWVRTGHGGEWQQMQLDNPETAEIIQKGLDKLGSYQDRLEHVPAYILQSAALRFNAACRRLNSSEFSESIYWTWNLLSLHPKWDPRRTIYQSNPGLTVDEQMENKLAFNDKKPVTFDPNITVQSSIALGFRAFVNKPRSKNPADQLPTLNAVPNLELTLYIAGAFCMKDDGEPCAGGGRFLTLLALGDTVFSAESHEESESTAWTANTTKRCAFLLRSKLYGASRPGMRAARSEAVPGWLRPQLGLCASHPLQQRGLPQPQARLEALLNHRACGQESERRSSVEAERDFKVTHRLVRDVAHAKYQSDEVSGPESVSKLLRESQRRNSEKRAQKYLRIYTDRVSTRIPPYAPYNSAIALVWLEEKKKNSENTRGISMILLAKLLRIVLAYCGRRRRRRMYYCGGPYKEQAGTVPTYNTSIDCTLQSSMAQSLRKHKHKCAPKHRTKKLGIRAWPVLSRNPEEREKLVAEHISKRPREMQDTCGEIAKKLDAACPDCGPEYQAGLIALYLARAFDQFP